MSTLRNLKDYEGKERACLAIGKTVVGLYFLTNEAKKENIKDLAFILDEAIARALKAGCAMYDDKLRQDFAHEVRAAAEDACIFIDHFCGIDDTFTKRGIANIVKYAQEEEASVPTQGQQ